MQRVRNDGRTVTRDDWRPDITEVVEHYGSRVVYGRGDWLKCTCPLHYHEDLSPSASINPDLGKFNCWACDVRGDGIDLVQINEGLSGFTEALARAKQMFNGPAGSVSRSGNGSRPGRRAWTPPWK